MVKTTKVYRLFLPHYPLIFNLCNSKKINIGWHGYDPYTVKDMHDTFLACGPTFKTGKQIPSFKNVDVFNLVNRILGLKYNGKIDGTDQLANEIITKQ